MDQKLEIVEKAFIVHPTLLSMSILDSDLDVKSDWYFVFNKKDDWIVCSSIQFLLK